MDKLEALTLLIPFLTEKEYNRMKKKILKEASNKTPSVGKNEGKKEVCPKTGFCNIAEQYGFCPYQCALFNREQTD